MHWQNRRYSLRSLASREQDFATCRLWASFRTSSLPASLAPPHLVEVNCDNVPWNRLRHHLTEPDHRQSACDLFPPDTHPCHLWMSTLMLMLDLSPVIHRRTPKCFSRHWWTMSFPWCSNRAVRSSSSTPNSLYSIAQEARLWRDGPAECQRGARWKMR